MFCPDLGTVFVEEVNLGATMDTLFLKGMCLVDNQTCNEGI